MSGFRFPGGDARTLVLGMTGSGKSTCGIWLLSAQRFDKRPWIAIDPKREEIFDRIGFPPIRHLALDAAIPKKPGLYLVSPVPGQEDALEAFLWRVWKHENVGLYVDEAARMPNGNAFEAILAQGRSKRIPTIACAQRPVRVTRSLFSEASFVCVYHMADRRDYEVIEGFIPGDLSEPLPRHCWWWFDRERHQLLPMAPVPPPATIAAELNRKLPYQPNAWHPFAWTGRPTGRSAAQ